MIGQLELVDKDPDSPEEAKMSARKEEMFTPFLTMGRARPGDSVLGFAACFDTLMFDSVGGMRLYP